MLAYIFPGQGSQFCGMGEDLFDEFPQLTAEADAILNYSIKTLCLTDPAQQLNLTQYTQPALYIVNALSYLKKIRATQRKPDFVAGHSLGEYSALYAAEIIDFASGLKLVKRRGELMQQTTGGSMAAIIGLSADNLQAMLQQHSLANITIANYNSYTQLVISGQKQAIQQIQNLFVNHSLATCIPLNVSGAFHSPYMLNAQQESTEYLNNFTFTMPTMPVIANLNALPYHPAVTQTNLAKQITHPVQWTKTIEFLLAQREIVFEEIGPGKVLTGLVQRIKNKK